MAKRLLRFLRRSFRAAASRYTITPSSMTIPLWILTAIQRPNELPVVNVVATVLILVSIVPVWLAQRISGAETAGARL